MIKNRRQRHVKVCTNEESIYAIRRLRFEKLINKNRKKWKNMKKNTDWNIFYLFGSQYKEQGRITTFATNSLVTSPFFVCHIHSVDKTHGNHPFHHSKKDLHKTTPMMGRDLLLKKDATSSRSKGNWRSFAGIIQKE